MVGRVTVLQKWSIFLIITLIFSSCKSTRIATDGKIDENLPAKSAIRSHYKSQLDFKTLSGRMKIDYSDGASSQGVGVSFRMAKDKAIWMSAPLGVVKAYITPNRVSFYNKLQNEYFDGDFSYLSDLLGTDLDFENLQNLMLGQALVDLRKDKYDISVIGDHYELRPKMAMDLFKTMFRMEPKNFKMTVQQLTQPLEKRLLEIRYKSYQEQNALILPKDIGIIAIDDDERTVIDIEYRNMEFGKTLTFPYKIPNGFEEIVLK